MATLDSIPLTLGALVGGGLAAVGLSAIVGFQTILYFQLFPMDTRLYKCWVAWIWMTDTGHTIVVCIIIWEYAVMNFNNPAKLLEIVPAYPPQIIFTVIATLNANAFYTWRIHKMSKCNWWITGLLSMLCGARTIIGLLVAIEISLSKTKTWESIYRFEAAEVASWTVSGATDIVISLARYYYLRELKQGYMATQEMVDAVVVFTINDGLLTCATILTVIACSLGMRQNFVWIGVFFILAKREYDTSGPPTIGSNLSFSLLQLCTCYAKPSELVPSSAQTNGDPIDASSCNPQYSPAGPSSTAEGIAVQQYP
ncbi:hypothetical protein MSAN_01113000 [Mycena sanguinolenta]|uniref:DUF6534 domain-containing protein n=1 Tax=Mycena sanguinolenta TaxID=230812 RepID=A0A8H7D6N1_9AGAR|nr:hypothetical protein MSAN_01113000 [Mycena sanguinolenta]